MGVGSETAASLHYAPPDFLSRVAASDQLQVVLFRENHLSGAGESGEVGNPGTLLMTQGERRIGLVPRLRRSDPFWDRFPSPSGLG
jgi:hypothetical protein